MADTLKPRDAQEVEDAVRWALGEDKPLELVGQGSKRAIGRPSQTDLTLDLSGLTGVTLYEPAELVLSARAGTPLAEIEKLLAENDQELGFEPIDYGPLFGREAGQGTLGGAIAANLSGPRRIKAGAARDHFLGLSAVTGRGDTIKSGGRVVKNVTGYDLAKLYTQNDQTEQALELLVALSIRTHGSMKRRARGAQFRITYAPRHLWHWLTALCEEVTGSDERHEAHARYVTVEDPAR